MSATYTLPLSPTLTDSSYGMVSNTGRSRSSTTSSDDEIVYANSSDDSSPNSSDQEHTSESDDDDFVILGGRRPVPRAGHMSATASAVTESILSGLSSLSLTRRPTPTALTLTQLLGTTQDSTPNIPAAVAINDAVKQLKTSKGVVAVTKRDQAQGIADDMSGVGSVFEGCSVSEYEEASRFLTAFLANPNPSVCRLTLLQSMITELRLPTGPLPPTSIRAAREILKCHAFVNIGDYLNTRGQLGAEGQEALLSIMLPTRSALKKNIRKKGNRIPRQVVKDHGLQALMVRSF